MMTADLNKLFQLDTLTKWLETKPPNKTYDYGNGQKCLLAQYFQENDVEDAMLGRYDLYRGKNYDLVKVANLPDQFDDIARGYNGLDWTFGGALERAKKVVATLRIRSSTK
jgi:hypothetical protein